MVGDVTAWRGFGEHLAVQRTAEGTYLARCLPGRGGRIFGGHVAAHGVVVAAAESGSGMLPLSMHVQFLRAGDAAEPVDYLVTAMRRGRSFEHWRVEAVQNESSICSMVVALHHPEDGPSHSLPNPDDSDPTSHLSIALSPRPGTNVELRRGLDMRRGGYWQLGDASPTPYQRLWLRCTEDLPDDPVAHAAVLVWTSDLEMTWSVDLPYREGVRSRVAASLDHVVYFHGPFDARRWWLYEQHSPVLEHGRALTVARAFVQGGGLLASVSQQSLLRIEFEDRQIIV